MNSTQTKEMTPASLPRLLAEDALEREAIRELERMERALNRKKSGYAPRPRGAYAHRC